MKRKYVKPNLTLIICVVNTEIASASGGWTDGWH